MKKAGYLLITLGFLAAALVAVIHVHEVDWAWFVPTLLIGVAGVVLVQRAEKAEHFADSRLAGNIQDIEASLGQILEEIKTINAGDGPADPYVVHKQIDEKLPEFIDRFVEARRTIGHVYGLQNYAQVMSEFAAGERYLNRVWSASADGYIDEVRLYLDKAEEQFATALERFKALRESTG